jgi:protein-S-isoprenylcysteine O-methyltransferase Ste14
MLLRALLAFLALPGVFAFLLPVMIASTSSPFQLSLPGIAVFSSGLFALLWCVRDFYVIGKGSLAPWSPPRHLVTVGLYRFTRNPMYVSVVLILTGLALLYQSSALALYTATAALIFHLRVVFGEEPWLARTYAEKWQTYQTAVPRWLWH